MSALERVADRIGLGAETRPIASDYDVLCVSSLPWGPEYPRAQQLLARCAHKRRVFVVEAARATDGPPRLEFHAGDRGIEVATPYLPRGLTEDDRESLLRGLLDDMVRARGLGAYVLWHDSPLTLGACRYLKPLAVVYDCAAGAWSHDTAGPALLELDDELVRRADLVFVGDPSAYAARRDSRPTMHVFPGSVDVEHFAQARGPVAVPADLAEIPRPRLGCFGALDAHLDLDLLADIADLRRDFHLVLLGRTFGLDPSRLPQRPNIHYLDERPYAQLPAYLAGWDVALLPYAAATRRAYPARALEYLAAGKPVVATPLRDVIHPYGVQGLVAIADLPEDFVVAVECELRRDDRRRWQQRVDAFIRENSWDRTWQEMEALISGAVRERRGAPA